MASAALRCGVLASLAIAAAGCGLFKTPPPLPTAAAAQSNILFNPGFEAGIAPWAPAPPQAGVELRVFDQRAHGGTHSVELKLTGAVGDEGSRASTATQSPIGTTALPEYVSGFYRVEDWQPHEKYQYLYFSLTVRGGNFSDGIGPHELRVLVGAQEEPVLERGVTYAFLSRAAPVLHEWTYFAFPIRDAVQSHFAQLPTLWEGIDVTVGVRYDDRRANDAPASADVLFDDLYAWPQAGNPNRPAAQ